MQKSNKTFRERVLKIVRGIKKGETMSYQEVAERAGSPKAYRAVANIMAKNYDLTVPCHRVIRGDGTLGGYNRGGIIEKQRILQKEGIRFS
jgi:O-6-methylguanine DNA methyltransferase